MEIRLIIERKGSAKPQVIRLHRATTVVGRQKGCDLRIPSARVSRRHCRFTIADDCLVVEDLKSANGTHLNGDRIKRIQLVHPGDDIEIGPVTMRVEYALTQTAINRFMKEQESSEFEAVAVDDDEPELVEVELVEEDEDAITMEGDEELVAVEVVDDDGPAAQAEEEPPIKFDEDDAWRLPADEDVRDILSKMDEKPK